MTLFRMLLNTSIGLLLAASSIRAAMLYLAGDSTMAADDGNDATIGWGPFVGQCLDIRVVNDAKAGRSSLSFTDEGCCNKIVPDDIAVIEFGHNDGEGPSASTGADATTICNVNGIIVYTFNEYMDDAVNALQAKSAKVIVPSQTPNNGSPWRSSCQGLHPKVTGSSYVDHFNLIVEEYRALGQDVVNTFYPLDHTHTSPASADIVAQAFVRGVICDSNNPLLSFVTNTPIVPTIVFERLPDLSAM